MIKKLDDSSELLHIYHLTSNTNYSESRNQYAVFICKNEKSQNLISGAHQV